MEEAEVEKPLTPVKEAEAEVEEEVAYEGFDELPLKREKVLEV